MIKIEKYNKKYIRVTSTEGLPIRNALGEVHSEYIALDENREQYKEVEA